MKFETSDYTIYIGDCRHGHKKAGSKSREATIRVKDSAIPYFDYNAILRITNSIYSMLYPGLEAESPDSEINIEIKMVNKPKIEDNNGIFHANIKVSDWRYNEKNKFFRFNISIKFFTPTKIIAISRFKICPSKLWEFIF